MTVVHRRLQLQSLLSCHNFDVLHSTMSPVLPFDIIALIIDIVAEHENKDTNLLKKLALVSHCFHQICCKHLFATIELHDANPNYHLASSKKGFAKLFKSRPDVVKHIRDLTYYVSDDINDDDHLLSPIFLNFLPTFSRLNCLTITAMPITPSLRDICDWNIVDSSLTSAFLHLMHLPTINHIDLSFIENFPLSNFTPSVNLHRLDISYLTCLRSFEAEGSPGIIMETMPKIREFHTLKSLGLTTKLLHARTQDGRPSFNFMDLRRVSMSFKLSMFEEEQTIRYLLQNAKLLEHFHLSVICGRIMGLRHLEPVFLGGICEELEALAGHNMLEVLSFAFQVIGDEIEDFIGPILQKLEKVLVRVIPRWSALRQVSFRVLISTTENSAESCEALQSYEYLSHLSKLESIAFNYSASFL